MSTKTIDKKVLIEVRFSCEDCDIDFHNEVIALSVLNGNIEDGHISLNGRIKNTVKACPICGKECQFDLRDLDICEKDEFGDETDIDDLMDSIFKKNQCPCPYPHYPPPHTPEPGGTRPWTMPPVGPFTTPYQPGYTGDPLPGQYGTVMCSTDEN